MSCSAPKTQKAIGIIKGIPKIGQMFKCAEFYKIPQHYIIQNEYDARNVSYYMLPGFARPCPTTPRHGFINSRTIQTHEDLLKLLNEVKKEDPKGEIALGPDIDFDKIVCNSVYTASGILAIGEKNDGATGGKGSFSIPVAPLKYSQEFLKSVKIKKTESVYLESIFVHRYGCFITQVRGGPVLNQAGDDYIPANVKVKKVVEPVDDLLAWEKQVKTFKAGTVVFGNGYTLASHAAVHCILNKIPFIVSNKPVIGETLKSTEVKEVKLTREGFKKGVCLALKMTDREELDLYFRYCLSVLHNWAYLRKSPQADLLLGSATTMFVKLCAALSCGEYRHNYKQKLFPNHFREDVYSSVMANGTKYLNKLPMICKDFCLSNWEEGFGGLPWASCAWYSATIWNNIIEVYNKGSKTLTNKEVSGLMDYMNRTINLVHNSDWWFDKISEKGALNFAAKHPGLCAALASNIFFRVKAGADSLKKVEESLTPIKMPKIPMTTGPSGKLACVYVDWDNDDWNHKCQNCGYYDCWCDNPSPKVADRITIKVWQEGKGRCYTKVVKITPDEYKQTKKHKLYSGKVYLEIGPKGIRLPSGRLLKEVKYAF